jgi:uncharacterized protein (DUF433 family)
MASKKIELVNHGRGLQLSTIRVTVQDLVPYFQEGCSYQEILRWIPALTVEEIKVVESYYHQNRVELDEQDRRIRKRNANRKNPEWVQKILAEGRVQRLAMMERLRQEKANGENK